MFLKNRNISSKIKRSKVTDYAALKWHYIGSDYVSMSSKTTPFSLEVFSFFKQLAGLIEEHLDLGPTTYQQI